MSIFRLTTKAEVPKLLAMITAAKAFLKQQGSPQWQNGQGPNESVLLADIARQESYVLESQGMIIGTAALVRGNDPVYQKIEGKWLNDSTNYIAIHHVAVDQTIRGQGIGKELLAHCITEAKRLGYRDIRIDTYPSNAIMRHLIEEAGFIECGMVHFPFVNGERVAYQLVVVESPTN